MVEIFKGKEINYSKIEILKNIAYKRYSQKIYNEYFKDIKNVEDLAYLHGVSTNAETLVIGTDWFLCYAESDYCVEILEWVSINNETKIKQVSEMMNILKQIFINNTGKVFIADMRHDTSYKIYLKLLQKGYFCETKHEYIIDCAAPTQVHNLKMEFMNRFSNIEEFLSSDESNNYSQYFKYILHRLSFVLTDKFIKKYSEPTSEASKMRIKKKKIAFQIHNSTKN